MSTSALKCIVLLLLLELSATLCAQTIPWQRINPKPFECSINDAQLLPNGRIVAVGSSSTVVSSDNFGSSWSVIYQPANTFYKTDLKSVFFLDEDNGWAVGAWNTIIRSHDGGLSWTLLQQTLNYQYYMYSDVEFITETEGFVIFDYFTDTLFKTQDAGITWEAITGLDDYSFTNIHFVSPEVGFMHGGGDYILKSTDGGSSWQKIIISPGVENLGINTLYFLDQQIGFIGATRYDMSSQDNYIYKTEDGGNTWEQVFIDNAYSSWSFSFSNADTGYSIGPVVWYSNNILRTIDGGDSWEPVTDTIGYSHLNTLCSDNNGNVIALGRLGQVYNSYNYGLNWSKSFSNTILGIDVLSSVILDDSSMVLSGEGGTGGVAWFRNIITHDRGNSWAEAEDFDGIVYDLCYLNDTIGFYCGGYGFSGGNNFIYKTTNAGLDWEFTEVGTDETILKKIEFIDNSIGFVGGLSEDYGYFVLYKTTNCGESWEEVNIGYYAGSYTEFDFYNDSSAIITGTFFPGDTNAQIIRTTDQGNTWSMVTLPFAGNFSHVHFINPDTGILFGWYKICKTVDGGENWYQVDFEQDEDVNPGLTYHFDNDGTGYLYLQGLNSYLFKTEDYGESWFEIDKPTTSVINTINFFSSDEGIIAGEDGIIFKTQTGGMVSLPEWKHEKDPQLLIYPNPSRGRFSVNIPIGYENGTCYVYDLHGKLIDKHEYNQSGQLSERMDLRKGVYIVRIDSRSSSISGKLIVM